MDLSSVYLWTVGLGYIYQGGCALKRYRSLRNRHIKKWAEAEIEKGSGKR